MKKIVLFLFIFYTNTLFAQNKTITDESQLWLGYFNQTRLTDKFGLWFDIHHRRRDHLIEQNSKNFVRLGFMYYFTDHLRFTLGYMYGNHAPEDGQKVDYNEHRPWQQLQWTQDYVGFRTMQWLRFEQRFREKIVNDEFSGQYNFNYRLRYNLALSVPLNSKKIQHKTWFLFANNEIFINFGQNIVYNYFDQNRLFAGISYQFAPHANIQIGYMNVFQQLASGDHFKNIHSLRIFVFHTIDLRKKKEVH